MYDSSIDNFATPDFRTDLAKIKSLGVDTIFTPFNPVQYITVVDQARELGLDVNFYSSWNTENQVNIDRMGSLAEGIVYSYSFKDDGSNKKYQEFYKNYLNKFNESPEANASNGYDSIYLIAKSIEKCGEDVSCLIKDTKSIKNYQGVSGNITFKDNIADKETFVKTIRNGGFEFLETE